MSDFNLGLTNYSPEQWALLKKVADDPEVLDDSYQDWLDSRDGAVLRFEALGHSAQLVEIDVVELQQWCHTNGRKLDGAARAEFCKVKLCGRGEQSEDSTK
jgi:hypothetical protein